MSLNCKTYSPTVAVNLSFAELYNAWQATSSGGGMGQLYFELNWLDSISQLRETLVRGIWQPKPTVCFLVLKPKIREIHAPHFSDRVVHHYLVPRLEQYFEPRFIYDSYANRVTKGSHKAVARLQCFTRKVFDGSGAGSGWYLQCDIKNFFYSIYRPKLYQLIKETLQHQISLQPEQREYFLGLQSLSHKLLAKPIQAKYAPDYDKKAIPKQKQLANCGKNCGLPIGNLSSQFFANVYLNQLDQFIKHQLKIKYFVRFADDFVCVSKDRHQLLDWQDKIQQFLQSQLKLQLKPVIVQPIANGIDFLGYRVYPHHKTVRPRVIKHCKQKLSLWQNDRVKKLANGWHIKASQKQLKELQAQLASYYGHFSHAHSAKCVFNIYSDFPWLKYLFLTKYRKDLNKNWKLCQCWQDLSCYSLNQQLRNISKQYPKAWIIASCGSRYWLLKPDTVNNRIEYLSVKSWQRVKYQLIKRKLPYLFLKEHAYLRHGARKRYISEWYLPQQEIK